jgi:hypothetical protein
MSESVEEIGTLKDAEVFKFRVVFPEKPQTRPSWKIPREIPPLKRFWQ